MLRTKHSAVGQNIYMQAVRSRPESDPRDRPLGAYLYGAHGASVTSARLGASLVGELGVTGPAALGETTQNGIHRLLGVTEVPAWDQQLRPRLGVNLHLDCRRSWPIASGVEVLGEAGASLGTMLNEARVAFGVMVGGGGAHARLPADARMAVAGSAAGDGWRLLAGLRVRAIGWDAALDGEAFGQRSAVSSRTWVGEGLLGVLSAPWRGWTASLFVVRRSADFSSAGPGPSVSGPQTFGTIALARQW